jgi:hypothetical protein
VARTAAYGVTSGLICMAAVMAVNAAPRGAYFYSGSAPRSPQVMLYISHSIGAGAVGRPTFGLKVDQLRQGGNTGDPEGGDVMQHRGLINWQMEAHSNMHISDLRVQLGDRVTYDLTHRAFGSPATRSTMQIGVPSLRNAALDSPQQRTNVAHTSASSSNAAQRDVLRDNSSIRELASAAVAALAPARFTAAQRQMVQRQGLPPQQRLAQQRGGYAGNN